MKAAATFILALLLAACTTSPPAPVVERTPAAKKAEPPKVMPKTAKPAPDKDWRPDTYTVRKGDTLYSIGLEHGYDYKEIAQRNDIQPPYLIRIGQQLKIKDSGNAPPATQTAAAMENAEAIVTPLKTDQTATPKTLEETPLLTEPKAVREPYAEAKAVARSEPPVADKPALAAGDDEAIQWIWPTNGKVLSGFGEATGAKGVDITGSPGQPVLAAAPGKVVYSGAGLRGYGKLVIIKHNRTYLSAYAHNSQILVKEGQEITRGQKIAEMGSSDTDRVKLHFEIRRLGKPVDPAKYLPPS